ncbi:unnamed protein product [Lampetra fluviatilis]
MQSGLQLAAWALVVLHLHGRALANAYARYKNAASVSPQDSAVRVGHDLTAVCEVRDGAGLGAADLRWVLNATPLGAPAVRVLDARRSEVTLTALAPSLPSGHNLLCVHRDGDVLLAGSVVYVGEPPTAPTELQCRSKLSEDMTCTWRPSGETHIHTRHTLAYRLTDGTEAECEDYETSGANSCFFRRENLYLFVTYRIWVVAHNLLGNATSAVLSVDPMNVAQPPPPANVLVVGPPKYPKQLYVSWTYPSAADPSFYPLQFQLRYRRHGASDWQMKEVGTQVTYGLYGLRAGTRHHVELRCRHSSSSSSSGGRGHWSEWSGTVTASTAPALKQKYQQMPLKQRKMLPIHGTSMMRRLNQGGRRRGRNGPRKQLAPEGP